MTLEYVSSPLPIRRWTPSVSGLSQYGTDTTRSETTEIRTRESVLLEDVIERHRSKWIELPGSNVFVDVFGATHPHE